MSTHPHQHAWRFDGDDPYIVCNCGERRDALTGRTLPSQPAREPNEILSAEDVARLHPGDTDFQLSKLCDSHEAMRAELAVSERSREEYIEETIKLRAALARVESERDDYRFWNERVRTCEQHTQDVAAPVGDCLICSLARAEARLAEMERVLHEITEMHPVDSGLRGAEVARAARASREDTGTETAE